MPSWLELPKSIWKDVDRIHLMSFDYQGKHATFDQARRDAEFMLKKGAPAWKIQLGLPLYGRKISDWNQALGYSEVVRQFSPKPEIDEMGGYFFNGPETLKNKIYLARELSLGGVYAWEIGQDSITPENSLLRHIVAAARPQGATQLRPDPKPAPSTSKTSGKGEKVNKPSRSSKSNKSPQTPPVRKAATGKKPG